VKLSGRLCRLIHNHVFIKVISMKSNFVKFATPVAFLVLIGGCGFGGFLAIRSLFPASKSTQPTTTQTKPMSEKGGELKQQKRSLEASSTSKREPDNSSNKLSNAHRDVYSVYDRPPGEGEFVIEGDDFSKVPPAGVNSESAMGTYEIGDDLVILRSAYWGDAVAGKQFKGGQLSVRADSAKNREIVFLEIEPRNGTPAENLLDDEGKAEAVIAMNKHELSFAPVSFNEVRVKDYDPPVNANRFARHGYPIFSSYGETRDGYCFARYVILADSLTVYFSVVDLTDKTVTNCGVAGVGSKIMVGSKTVYYEAMKQ
jgi:hypothetical protein